MTTTARAHIPDRSELPLNYRILRKVLELSVRISPMLASRIGAQLFSTPVGRAKVRMIGPMQQALKYDVPYENGRLAVYEWGEAGKPVVMLVHGWRSKAEQFRYMVEPLLTAGYQVVAFDLPAHGNSSGRQTNPLKVSQAIEAVASKYGALRAIIAHSFGTFGVAFLTQHRPKFPVEKLVMISGPDHVSDITANFVKLLGLSDDVSKVIDRGLEIMAGQSVDALRSSALLPKFGKPGLIIHDREDTEVLFECGERIAEKWVSAEFHPTTGLGHHKILRDPDVIDRIIAFLLQSDAMA